MTTKKTICVITCYKHPDYIRAKTLRAAIESRKDTNMIIVKNSRKGFLRYFEVLAKIIAMRVKYNPDIYILTFRGYEMLPFVRIITVGKRFVFDEFINLIEWTVYEQKKIKEGSIAYKLLFIGYRFWLKSADLILTDTVSHAEYSSDLMNIPIKKYLPLIVSTDEGVFKATKAKRPSGTFKAFYYGSMLPLHGVDVVIDTMKLLNKKDIQLTLIGGNEQTREAVEAEIKSGSKIDYKKWVNFEELPAYMQESDVCLAGPFGGTFQSQFVITGKAYQYMQMKRPIIVGKNKESYIFTDKKDALIVKQASAKALADSINWAYEHRDKLTSIGEAGYKLYQQKLSNKALALQLDELFFRFEDR